MQSCLSNDGSLFSLLHRTISARDFSASQIEMLANLPQVTRWSEGISGQSQHLSSLRVIASMGTLVAKVKARTSSVASVPFYYREHVGESGAFTGLSSVSGLW